MGQDDTVFGFPDAVAPQHKTVSGLMNLLMDVGDVGTSFLPLSWRVFRMDSSLLGWGSALNNGTGYLVTAGEVVPSTSYN